MNTNCATSSRKVMGRIQRRTVAVVLNGSGGLLGRARAAPIAMTATARHAIRYAIALRRNRWRGLPRPRITGSASHNRLYFISTVSVPDFLAVHADVLHFE